MKNILLKIIIIINILLPASACYALDMEYYTWNGFDIEVEAWRILTLIFSDNGYKTLFFAVITMGIFLGGFSTMFGLLSGQKQGSSFSWAWPLGLGVVLYLALIVPKGNLTIYDPVVNKYQTIPEVPNGLVAVAGVLNKIEKGLSDIISTSGGYPPGAQYDNAAGGIGVSIILAFTGMNTLDAYLNQSLDEYIKECVLFEMNQSTPAITLHDLDTTNDLLTVLGAAGNPAVWVTYWDSSNPGGTTLTCNTAWTNLNNILNQQATFTQWEKRACSSAGFDVSDAAQVQRCEGILGSTIEYLYNDPSFGATTFILNAVLAKRLDQVISTINPELTQSMLANKQAFIGGEGATIVASQYIPIAKAIFKAIIIGMIPFLMLFLPTTLSGRTIGIIAGFFVFVTCWGICDVIIHNLIMVRTFNELQNIRDHGMSYTSVVLWPSSGQRALNLYGNMRAGSVMFAAIISAVICKFGNYALTAIAGGVSGMVTTTGHHAGAATLSPEVAGQHQEQLRGSIAPMMNARSNDFEQDAFARGAKHTGSMAGDITAMQQFGGPAGATGQYRMAGAGNTVDQVSAGAGKFHAGLDNVAQISSGTAAGAVKGQLDRQESSGMSAEEIQRQATAAIPVVTPTGDTISHKGSAEAGWASIENENGVRYERTDGTTAFAQAKNWNPQVALNNKEELSTAASNRLQTDVNWKSMFSDTKQFAKDNRISEETANSAEKAITNDFAKRVSENDALSEATREAVRKDISGNLRVGYRAGGWGGLAPYADLSGGMTIGKLQSNDKSVGHTLSTQEAQSLNKMAREAESESIRRSLSNADSESWAKQLTASVGSSETKSLTEMSSRSISLSESQSQNITGNMVDFVKQKYNVSGNTAMGMLNNGYEGRDADTAVVASNVLMGKNISETIDGRIEAIGNEVRDKFNEDNGKRESLINDVKSNTGTSELLRNNPLKKPKAGLEEDMISKKIMDSEAKIKAEKDQVSVLPGSVKNAKDAIGDWVSGGRDKK